MEEDDEGGEMNFIRNRQVCLVEQERMKQKQRDGDYFNVFNTLAFIVQEMGNMFLACAVLPEYQHTHVGWIYQPYRLHPTCPNHR